MNKRIKELAKQAGGNPNYKAFRGHFLPPPPDYIDPATVDLEKFAELIVRECANAIINDSRLNDVRSAANGCVRTINEYFGVVK
jgi:hypothetical protein